MNFTQVVNEVLTITARPDRLTEIQSAVNGVLAKLILKTNFYKDLVEISVPVDANLYGDTVDLSTHVTRFRKIKYVKPAGVLCYLTPLPADKVFTPGGHVQRDVYYMAGLAMTYVLKEQTSSLEIGYYQYAPVLSDSSPDHWFLEMLPWTIIDLAAARIFRSIGDEGSANAYERSGMDLYLTAYKDFEDGTTPLAR